MPVRHDKHVHFAHKNTVYTPPVTLPMPPLTFSASPKSSSPGVITPPSLYYQIPTSSTSHYGGSPRAHPYLEMSGISWDMMDHPSTISRHNHAISSPAWEEPATTPPLPFITITIANFPWKFNVFALNHSYVTFEDVVEAIYHSLRKDITEFEFRAITSATDRRRATRAYEQRYRRQLSTRLYEEEKRGGMKRIDFLMESTRFAGIVNISRHSDEWNLNVT